VIKLQLNKWKSIEKLRALEINAPATKLISYADSEREVLRKIIWAIKEGEGKVSIRTFPRSEEQWAKNPLICVCEGYLNTVMKVKSLLKQGYNVSVGPAIDPKHCIIAGTCWKRSNGTFIIEMVYGPGTVRRITREGKIDYTIAILGEKDIEDANPIIQEVIKRAKKIPEDNIIIEWSYYHIRIGHLKDFLIFWDYLPGGGD